MLFFPLILERLYILPVLDRSENHSHREEKENKTSWWALTEQKLSTGYGIEETKLEHRIRGMGQRLARWVGNLMWW